MDLAESKRCSRCSAMKAITEFSRCKNRPDGRQNYCKACARESHAEWWQRRTAKDDERGSRVCCRCKTEKSLSEFTRTKGGWQHRCRDCEREYLREHHYVTQYGITVEAYEELLDKQGGGCAICKGNRSNSMTETLPVDHDHSCCPGKKTCGKCLRGLLCDSCNRGLGFFEDNIGWLQAAIDYLTA